MSTVSFLLRLAALFVFCSAAIVVFGWFGVTSGPDPRGLAALGLAGWVLADLCDKPRPHYFRQ